MSVEGERLLGLLRKLEQRTTKLENSNRAPQLPWSTVDVNAGRGSIPFLDGSEVRAVMGRQPDGTVTLVHPTADKLPIVPKNPVCTPTLAGVEVECIGFLETQFADFSHVNVYCDNIKMGSIIKIPGRFIVSPLDYISHNFQLSSVNLAGQESPRTPVVSATPSKVVGSDITNGIITELKLANDAVTAAKVAAAAITTTKIADDAVTTQKVVANAITSVLIAASAISADKIAVNAVTAEKIEALAITADKIATNAITAGKIQAGSVTADKLAAQIILATISFIAGDPLGERLVVNDDGITQYDAQGNIILQFGASPLSNGNFLTIPNVDGTILASLDSEGSLTVSGFNLIDDSKNQSTVNGLNLFEVLERPSQGIIARCYHPNSGDDVMPTTATQIGLVELKAYLYGGRSYRICTNTIYNTAGDTTTEGELRIHYKYSTTNNGARPTLSDPAIAISARARGFGAPFRIDHPIFIAPEESGYYYFLLAVTRLSGSNLVGIGGFIHLYVEDDGSTLVATGGRADGTGTDTGTPQQYTKTYTANAIRTYSFYGSSSTYDNEVFQGWHNDTSSAIQYKTIILFDYAQIISDLNGATIQGMEVGLTLINNPRYSGGTIAKMGFSTATSLPSGYTYHLEAVYSALCKKEVRTWISITDTAHRNSIQAGNIKGVNLSSNESKFSTIAYGYFYGSGDKRPQLRITYTK